MFRNHQFCDKMALFVNFFILIIVDKYNFKDNIVDNLDLIYGWIMHAHYSFQSFSLLHTLALSTSSLFVVIICFHGRNMCPTLPPTGVTHEWHACFGANSIHLKVHEWCAFKSGSCQKSLPFASDERSSIIAIFSCMPLVFDKTECKTCYCKCAGKWIWYHFRCHCHNQVPFNQMQNANTKQQMWICGMKSWFACSFG